jgi:hypothetical protein
MGCQSMAITRGCTSIYSKTNQSLLCKANVLVIGDSTTRRFYHTLLGMIIADDLKDVKQKRVDDEELMNSHHKETSCADIGGRQIENEPILKAYFCRNFLIMNEEQDPARGEDKSTASKTTVKFDLLQSTL